MVNHLKSILYRTTSVFILTIVLVTASSATQAQINKSDSLHKELIALEGDEFISFLERHFSSITNQSLAQQAYYIDSLNSIADLSEGSQINCKLIASQYEAAQKNYEQGIKLAFEVKSNRASSPYQIAKAHLLLRDQFQSFGLYHRALDAHETIDWKQIPWHWEAQVPNYFSSNIYYQFGEFEKAIKTLRASIAILKANIDDPRNDYWIMSLTNNLGLYFEKANELDSALHYYNQALALLIKNKPIEDSLQNQFVKGLFKGNKAQILMKQERYLEAIPLLKQDIRSSKTSGYGENTILSQGYLIKCYLNEGNLNDARTVLKEMERLQTSFNFKHPEFWLIKSEFQSLSGLKDSAINALKMHVAYKDSISSVQKRIASKNLRIDFDTSEQLEKIETQNKKLEALKTSNKEKLLFLYVSAAVSTLFFILLLIILKAYQAKSKSERELKSKSEIIEQQKNELAASIYEKDLLFKEVNHRVKNNLQIVSSLLFFHRKLVKDSATKEVLAQAQSRIQSMSYIHQKLYETNNIGSVDLKGFVEGLLIYINKTLKSPIKLVTCVVETQDHHIAVQQAIPIGLILHELSAYVVDSKSRIDDFSGLRVTFIRSNKELKMLYTDPREQNKFEDLINTESIHLKLIKLLTTQLNGYYTPDANSLDSLIFYFRVND